MSKIRYCQFSGCENDADRSCGVCHEPICRDHENHCEYEDMDSETLIIILKEKDRLIEDYQEWGKDVKRLTREIDVALHGEEGAAKQASLCDLVGPAEYIRQHVKKLEESNALLSSAGTQKFLFASPQWLALERQRDLYQKLYYQAESELCKLVESLDPDSIATDVS